MIPSSIPHHKNIISNASKSSPYVFSDRSRSLPKIPSEIKHLSPSLAHNDSHILTVLVHGYNGSQFDLSRIKSYLNHYLGLTNFLALREIQHHIAKSMIEVGVIGAEELMEYLKSRPQIKYINFIGFSMGGVIIRSMLPHLKEIKEKLLNLVTFATPHLGLRLLSSCVVRMGLSFINKIKGVQSIKQLCVGDGRTGDGGTMMMLAEDRMLKHFSNIILAASQSDEYVPMYSALLSYPLRQGQYSEN